MLPQGTTLEREVRRAHAHLESLCAELEIDVDDAEEIYNAYREMLSCERALDLYCEAGNG